MDMQSRQNVSPKLSSDYFSRVLDPSMKGLELVQLKKGQSRSEAKNPASSNMKESPFSKDSSLSIDTNSTSSSRSLPSETNYVEGRGIQRHLSGGEWVDMLDVFSRRKTEALAPEHFDNMWTKGRNYKRKEGANQVADPVKQSSLVGASNSVQQSKVFSGQNRRALETTLGSLERDGSKAGCSKRRGAENTITKDFKKHIRATISLNDEKDEPNDLHSNEIESESSGYSTEDEDNSRITGTYSPHIGVWDAKNKRSIGRIHHPLESFEGHKSRKASKGHLHSLRLHKTLSKRKRSRSSGHNGHIWQEVGRTSFLLGDRPDVLNSSVENIKHDGMSDDFAENLGRVYTGATTSSSILLAFLPESHCLPAYSKKKFNCC